MFKKYRDSIKSIVILAKIQSASESIQTDTSKYIRGEEHNEYMRKLNLK